MYKIIKGDLFKVAPKKAFLLHACNCQGSWGSGVARSFQIKYPNDYKQYREVCELGVGPGDVFISDSNIICLFVSDWYGKFVDGPFEILKATKACLERLESFLMLPTGSTIYSPKINSGLFRTPWKDTEALILAFLEVRPDITWYVCEL